MKSFVLAAWAAAAAISAQAGPINISLLPVNGNVAGKAGTVVGWGFTLTDTSPNQWVVLTGSSFTGSPVFGTYVDYLSLPSAPLYVAGPAPESSSVLQAWNHSSTPPLGLGEFDINSTASAGPIPGNILVHYSVFSQDPNDPNFDPDTSTVIADATISNPADVTVVPEPSAVWTMGAGLLGLALLARWRLAW